MSPRAHLAMSGDIFDGHNWSVCVYVYAVGIPDRGWDAAENLTIHRAAPQTKNYRAPNISSVDSEKLL